MQLDLLFISDQPPYNSAHQKTLLYYLGAELSPKRTIMDLVCFYDQPEDLAEVPRYEHFFRHVTLIPVPANVLKRPLNNAYPQEVEKAWSSAMWEAAENYVRNAHYDLVHLFGGIRIYEYQHLIYDLPHVITLERLQSPFYDKKFQNEKNWFKRQQFKQEFQSIKQYEQWVYRGFKLIVVSTPEEAKALKTADNKAKVIIQPLGVDTDYFDPTEYEAATPGLLFIGDFAEAEDLKTAQLLIQNIFPAVKKSIPKAHLYIVGKNPPPRLLAMASDSIDILEKPHDLRPLFELALIYIAPIQDYTGLRQDILQAMAMMTPVITTYHGSTGIDIKPEHDVILGKTAADFSQQVIRLFQDRELRQRLRMNGQRLIESRYAWQQIVSQYENLYQQLMDE